MLIGHNMPADHGRESTARTDSSPATTTTPPAERPSLIRYRVLTLTFLVAFMMYMDRTCMGIATPTLMREFGVNKVEMSFAISAYNVGYTLFQVPAGWMADRY